MNEITQTAVTPGTRKREANPQDETTQLRAEVAMLRAQVTESERARHETLEQKQEHKRFLAWIALDNQQKTQLVADQRFGGQAGDLWEVSLPENPTVRLPAHSEYEAIGRYCELCGITATAHKYTATCVKKVA
jgi:hypothetical protein